MVPDSVSITVVSASITSPRASAPDAADPDEAPPDRSSTVSTMGFCVCSPIPPAFPGV